MFEEILDKFDQDRIRKEIRDSEIQNNLKERMEEENDILTGYMENVIIPVMRKTEISLVARNYPCKIKPDYAVNEETGKKWYSGVGLFTDLSMKFGNESDAIKASKNIGEGNSIQFIREDSKFRDFRYELKIQIDANVKGKRLDTIFCFVEISKITGEFVENKIEGFLNILTTEILK